MTGSYRQDNVIELWDLRVNKKYRDINWDGPKALEIHDMTLEEDKKVPDEENKENHVPHKEEIPINRDSPSPYIYSC